MNHKDKISLLIPQEQCIVSLPLQYWSKLSPSDQQISFFTADPGELRSPRLSINTICSYFLLQHTLTTLWTALHSNWLNGRYSYSWPRCIFTHSILESSRSSLQHPCKNKFIYHYWRIALFPVKHLDTTTYLRHCFLHTMQDHNIPLRLTLSKLLWYDNSNIKVGVLWYSDYYTGGWSVFQLSMGEK